MPDADIARPLLLTDKGFMRVYRNLAAIILTLVVAALVAGCASGASEKKLTIGTTDWDESVAVSNLTKALLRNELGYDKVELKPLDVSSLFKSVASGDLDAFQAARVPDHQEYLASAQDDIELLDPWFEGTAKVGIATPSYMNVRSIPQLNQTGAKEVIGIEPEAPISKRIPDEVIPTYHLEQEYVEWSAPAMLYEVGKRISNREDFAFVAWRPHWMNQRYNLVYLDDPEHALGELDNPSTITTVVRKHLRDDDPTAYALMKALTLTEEQVEGLEEAINGVGDPMAGAETWAKNNQDIVQPWIDAAQLARQKS
ncbi:MAG: glycine betaine ABC transporter substrate-binding protein [Rubrobacter sp.]|nr:glycine betaine ABC transporter substrate-binding protein [Rubrobacter sp.]